MDTGALRERWERDGFFVIPGFAAPETCRAMLERAREICRAARGAGRFEGALVVPEARPDPRATTPEDLDCFGSQFIFKQPGALGQPWHQDAWYFPFDRGPQVGGHPSPVHDWLPVRRGRAAGAEP